MKRLLLLLVCLTLLGRAGLTETNRPSVTLRCVDRELKSVLRELATRMRCNIYIGPGVEGKVTADLSNVSAEAALGLVLRMQTRAYRYKIVGHTVVVATPEKLSQISDDILDSR